MAKIFPDYYSNNSDNFFYLCRKIKGYFHKKKNHQFKKKKNDWTNTKFQ